jgi:hypothetical protein
MVCFEILGNGVANMASYAISSSMILVIHDNMINVTNHIVEHVFVDISRSQGCKNITCQNEKIVYILMVNRQEEKEKQKTPSDDPTVHFLDVSDEWKRWSSRRQ